MIFCCVVLIVPSVKLFFPAKNCSVVDPDPLVFLVRTIRYSVLSKRNENSTHISPDPILTNLSALSPARLQPHTAHVIASRIELFPAPLFPVSTTSFNCFRSSSGVSDP